MGTLEPALRPRAEPTLQQKVAFLALPASYPAPAHPVRAIETHLSWVFLTGDRAYKLKKPLRLDHHGLLTVDGRRDHCQRELELNRRLTDGVYLGMVPLSQAEDGALHLGTGLRTVDWLIVMRRLPAGLMLDRLVRRHAVRAERLDAFVQRMAAFYAASERPPETGADRRDHFAGQVALNTSELCRFAPPLAAPAVEEVAEAQLAWLERHGGPLDARVAAGMLAEGHGDLRPEHVCLEAIPQVIDCLEFSRDLRIVDRAEEMAFVALECERLGDAGIGVAAIEAYERITGDRAPPALLHFYQSCHALTRARLAIRHLDDGTRHASKWTRRARQYLRLAASHIARAAA